MTAQIEKPSKASSLVKSILSNKTKNLLSKKFDDGHPEGKEQETPQIDVHVKMNDNYLRTGPYKPKKK